MNGRGAGLQKKIIIVKLYIHRKCILRWRNNNTLLSAFVNEEEAEKECSCISDNIEKYRAAKTINELLEYYNG